MLCNLLGVGKWLSGYRQTNPIRLQPRHSGIVSEHLTLRRLQLKQPRRDLLKPFPGTGFFFLLRSDGLSISVFDVIFSPPLGGVAESVSVEIEVSLEAIGNEFTLPISNASATLEVTMLSEDFFKPALLAFET